MFNSYREKIIAHLNQLIEELPERIAALDFTLDESLSLEPDEQSWAADKNELADRTRKSLKNTVLGLKLADKDSDAIIETLTKRYTNQRQRIKQLNAEDAFQTNPYL